MNRIAGEGSGLRRYGRGLGLLGGLAAVAAIAVLAVGPAGAQTSTTSSTTSSSTTSTTEGTTTTTSAPGTQNATVQFVCYGTTATDQATLNQVGAASNGSISQDTSGNYYTVSKFAVTTTVPSTLNNGQTVGVSFSAQLDTSSFASQSIPGLSIAISGDPTFVVTGGATGGPFAASPTGGTITPPTVITVPPSTASGNITVTDATTPIIFAMQNPLHSSIAITLAGAPLFSWNQTCNTSDPNVASANGSLPPAPPTTLPPTVAPAAKATTAAANFTG
jgi:hypothetical protein